MSKPTDDDLKELRAAAAKHDDERYHSRFDDLLERKLAELDPEWMRTMQDEYQRSGMGRWYA